MKRRYPALAAIFLVTLSAVSALAQTESKPARIGFINSGGFYDEQQGITRIVRAGKQLNAEMKPRYDEINELVYRLQSGKKAYDQMQELPEDQLDKAAFESRRKELERLQSEIKSKQDKIQTDEDKRMAELMTPIMEDVGKAMGEFAKQNGYTAIFDVERLASAGAVLYVDEAVYVTKQFIAYYNSRPTPTQ